MKITLARAYDLDGLYIDGLLKKQATVIDIDDVLIIAGREPFTLEKKYLNEDWLHHVGWELPTFEVDLVELDS